MPQALGGITEMEWKCPYCRGLCVSASFLTSHPVSPNLALCVDVGADGRKNPMGRLIGRLTELQVRRLPAGWHNDGGGLYLRVQDRERRWWVFRYGPQGRRYRGLGPTHTLSLAAAREQAR